MLFAYLLIFSISYFTIAEPLTKQFGLTAEQFGENLRDDYQRYEVEQCHTEPLKEAESYLSKYVSITLFVLILVLA